MEYDNFLNTLRAKTNMSAKKTNVRDRAHQPFRDTPYRRAARGGGPQREKQKKPSRQKPWRWVGWDGLEEDRTGAFSLFSVWLMLAAIPFIGLILSFVLWDWTHGAALVRSLVVLIVMAPCWLRACFRREQLPNEEAQLLQAVIFKLRDMRGRQLRLVLQDVPGLDDWIVRYMPLEGESEDHDE